METIRESYPTDEQTKVKSFLKYNYNEVYY